MNSIFSEHEIGKEEIGREVECYHEDGVDVEHNDRHFIHLFSYTSPFTLVNVAPSGDNTE